MAKGMTLALIGVSNGAIQFMTYEELKKRRVDLRRRRLGAGASEEEVKRLVSRLKPLACFSYARRALLMR